MRVDAALQAALEAEMMEATGAAKGADGGAANRSGRTFAWMPRPISVRSGCISSS